MFNLNPKKMEAMMKQIGMEQENINASRVVIEKKDGSKININNPNVTKIKIQGQESYQIVGEVDEELSISEEDIKTVMEKTNKSHEESKKALEGVKGDLAEAILELSN